MSAFTNASLEVELRRSAAEQLQQQAAGGAYLHIFSKASFLSMLLHEIQAHAG